MQNELLSILESNDVVLFVHSEKLKEENSFSKKATEFLSNYKIDFKLVPVDKKNDIDLFKQIISRSKWELLPQLFVKKEFIGGYFVIAEFILSGELARITKNKANLPLDSKYKSSKQNSIWRMKKVEPDRVLYSTADSNLVRLSGETEELIRIFVTSIKTAQKK